MNFVVTLEYKHTETWRTQVIVRGVESEEAARIYAGENFGREGFDRADLDVLVNSSQLDRESVIVVEAKPEKET